MRYTVWYKSTTGYGWKRESNSLWDFTGLLKECRNGNYYISVHIYDERVKDFVFWKDALERKPEIDRLKY